MFAWGTAFYGLGFYLLRLSELRGWSIAEISNVVFVFYLAAVVLSFWVSKQLARRGPRAVIALGAVAMGLALLAMPHVSNLALLVVVFLVLSLGWSATNSNPISTTVLAWFPNGQRQLSIALVGASLGGIVLIPVLGDLDQRFGFTVAMTALALTTTATVGGLAVAFIDRPESVEPVDTGRSIQRADRMAWSITRGPDYWILGTGLAAGIAVQGGFLVHQLSMLTEVVTASTATRIVGVATAAAFVGRFGPVVVGDRLPAAIVGAGYLAVQTVALALLAVIDNTPAVLTAMNMLFGVGVGVLITMPSLLTRATYPHLPFTSAFPVVNLSFQLPLAAGAPALALLHTRLGGYRSAMWALAALDLGAAVLLVWNHRRTGLRQDLRACSIRSSTS
ncbi:MAG: MFS transporter [Acidimicrobiales bacterium]